MRVPGNKNIDVQVLQEIHGFLGCKTPDSWIEAAVAQPSLLLIDHANCEKKAASSALNLLYRYTDNFSLLDKMSRLAREELRHFEQVLALMKSRNIVYQHLSAARYASDLHCLIRKSEPGRLIDTLIVGAIIEARSCERFARLAPHLDGELEVFYLSLLKSEARHYQDYLGLAKTVTSNLIDDRVELFLAKERELIEFDDDQFRFHSGVPATGGGQVALKCD